MAKVKHCSACKTEKALEEFGRDKNRIDGISYYCKPCNRIQNKASFDRLRETPEGRARLRRRRWLTILASYGISESQYMEMYELQKGLCAICKLPERVRNADQVRPLCVDHDHESGTVRGLLCHSCNVAIGHFRDDPDRLESAIRYLRGE